MSSKSRLIILSIFVASLLPHFSSTGTVLNPYSGNGDWTITTGETISDIEIAITGNIFIDSPDRVSFVNCNLTVDDSIVIIQGSHSFLNNNILSKAGNLIYIKSGSSNNLFDSNNLNGTVNTAIRIMSSDGNTFINNNISNLGLASYGFYIHNSDLTTLTSNGITTSGVYGVLLSNSNDSSISGNTIESGTFFDSYPIYEKYSSNNFVSQNIIGSSSSSPIAITNSHYSEYTDNIIYSISVNPLITIDNSANLLINANRMNSSLSFAIDDFNSRNLNIRNNLINSSSGIDLENGLYHSVHNNTIITDRTSLMISNTHNSTFINNTILDTSTGFNISSSNFLIFKNSTIKADRFMYLDKAQHNLIEVNSVNCSNYCISSLESHYNTINSNDFHSYDRVIDLLSSNGNSILNNTINGTWGIDLRDSNSNNILNNSIQTDHLSISITASSNSNNISLNNISSIDNSIYLSRVQENTIDHNNVFSVDGNAIRLDSFEFWYTKNTIINNTLFSINGITVYLYRPNHGFDFIRNNITSVNNNALYLVRSIYNDFLHNTLTSINSDAVIFDQDSEYSEFKNNTVISNFTSISLTYGDNNYFGYNSFISSDISVSVLDNSVGNVFDNNIYLGEINGLFPFTLITNTTDVRVGDSIIIDSSAPIFYRWSGYGQMNAVNNQIPIVYPNQDSIDIWTSSNRNRYLVSFLFNTSKEYLAPTIISSNQSFTIHEDVEFTLYWNCSDIAPDNYKIFINDSLIVNGIWINDNLIVFKYSLSAGYHIIQIHVYDTSGNFATNSISITSIDITIPLAVEYPKTIDIIEKSSIVISWSLIDKHPNYYHIFIDDILVITLNWTSGVTINFTFSGYAIGTYTILILAYDSYGNHIELTTLVTVTENTPVPSSITTISSSEKSKSSLQLYSFFISLLLLIPYRRRKL